MFAEVAERKLQRGGEKDMAKYKITRGYMVEAKSKIEAREIFVQAMANDKEEEFLEYMSIKEVPDSHGWVSALKDQFVGNGKR